MIFCYLIWANDFDWEKLDVELNMFKARTH